MSIVSRSEILIELWREGYNQGNPNGIFGCIHRYPGGN